MYAVLIKERSTKILRPIEKLIEKRKEEFIRNNLMSDEFIDFIQKNKNQWTNCSLTMPAQLWK